MRRQGALVTAAVAAVAAAGDVVDSAAVDAVAAAVAAAAAAAAVPYPYQRMWAFVEASYRTLHKRSDVEESWLHTVQKGGVHWKLKENAIKL